MSNNAQIGVSYSLAQLAAQFDLEFRGDGQINLSGLATLQDAGSNQLSFLASANYAKHLPLTQAGAVILTTAFADTYTGNCLVSSNPYLVFAQISALFDCAPVVKAGIHSCAVIHENAEVDALASVAAGAVIETGAVIAAGVRIGSNCVVGADTAIGENTILHANVTLAYGVTIGQDSIVHSGAVIGADGFGFAPQSTENGTQWIKIFQLGGVVIGDRVEIGANTTIDRGALGDTMIGNGVKIDNQCQIAHNVTIGDNTAIASATAIAGSTQLGSNCTIAGCVGIVGHIDIADGVHITGMSMVSKSIASAGSYSSGMPMMDTAQWRKSAVRVRQLDKMASRIKQLEKTLLENHDK